MRGGIASLANQSVETIANQGLDYRVTFDAIGEPCLVESRVYTGLGCYHYRKIWKGEGMAGLTASCAIRAVVKDYFRTQAKDRGDE